jgi:hypothetical protein
MPYVSIAASAANYPRNCPRAQTIIAYSDTLKARTGASALGASFGARPAFSVSQQSDLPRGHEGSSALDLPSMHSRAPAQKA